VQENKINKGIGKVLKTSLGCTKVWRLVKKKRDTELKTSPETNDKIKTLSSGRYAFKIASSLRSTILLNHVHAKEIYQTQISSSPQGTPLGISVRSDLRVLTLENRDGDLTSFTWISFKPCLTPPTELAAHIVCPRDNVLQKVWFYPFISMQISRKILNF
jgi:hypothetical protein